MNTKKHVLSLVMMLSLASVSWAEQPPADPFAEFAFPPELLLQKQDMLGLSEAQRDFVRRQLEEMHGQFTAHEQQLRGAVSALHDRLQQESPNEEKVLQQLDKVLDAERTIKRLHLGLLIRLHNKLTPEQRKEVKRLQTAMQGQQPGLERRLHEKLERVKQAIHGKAEAGQPPHDVIESMQQFPKLMEKGAVKEAEALLDRVLKQLEED